MTYLPLYDLDVMRIESLLPSLAQEHPGMSVSIDSMYGPICGFVPHDSQGSVKMTLRNEYFLPEMRRKSWHW